MNLQPYRKSFVVFVADSNINRGTQVIQILTAAGYSAEHRVNAESLIHEIVQNPPHIILFNYSDEHFFSKPNQYTARLETISNHLPEVQLIFLSDEASYTKACELYELDIYDVVAWPTQNPIEILKSVDRAAECDYYMYLNEQLREQSGEMPVNSSLDFGLYEKWLKEIESCTTRDELIDMWMKEALRVLKCDYALYMRFVETKKTLVIQKTVGNAPENLQGLGIDLIAEEPGFEIRNFKQPNEMQSLHSFVMKGLLREQAAYFTFYDNDQVLGVCILPAQKNQIFTNEELDSSYLKCCMRMLNRQIEHLVLKEQIEKYSIYDSESDALRPEFLIKKVKEEVSRARRIVKPLSVVLMAIDGYNDMTLRQTKGQLQKFLKGLTEILINNSRLNDLVGRVERDKYVICLPHTDLKGAGVKAERLRRLMQSADFSSIFGQSQQITISVGVSEYPSICHDAEQLLDTAEKALYIVRKSGNNRISLAVAPEKFNPDFLVNEAEDVSSHSS